MSGISKKVRFEIFKRDLFTCAYCGSTPPAVVLQIDHIHPVSKGGGSEKDNLITACFDCNSGKSNRLLTAVPDSIEQRAQLLQEKEDQLKAYKTLQRSIKSRENIEITAIEDMFCESFEGYSLNASFKKSIRVNFLPRIDGETLVSNMEMACVKIRDNPERAIKYFCGINWRMIERMAKE
jgi:hypothetical protein